MHVLASIPPSLDWSARTWPEIADLPDPARTIAILPLCGFYRHAGNLPLNHEEIQLATLLASPALTEAKLPLLILPPLRFVLGPTPDHLFALDPETAHQHLLEITASIHSAGLKKILFLNAGAASKELAATAAIDARVAHGLDTYLIHLPSLSSASQLTSLLAEISSHRVREPGRVKRFSTTQPRAFPAPAVHQSTPRSLTALTPRQLDALPDKQDALLILQTASIEQHGHHLPLATDALLGQALLTRALDQLPAHAPVYLLPPITYGKSNEHHDWPGTLTISAQTLGRVVLALATQARRLGFRRLAVFNSHGGNTTVLTYTLREIEATLQMEARLLAHGYKPTELEPQEAAYGFHAGEWETSLMLALAPQLVCMDKATSEFPARLDDPGQLRPENAPATFAWTSRDVSRSGVMGDATRATAEKGLRWLDASSASLARRIAIELTARRQS